MLCAAVAEACGPSATFDEFAETARRFIEAIPGLETLTERQASRLVKQLRSDHMAKKATKESESDKHKKGEKEAPPQEQESTDEKPVETAVEELSKAEAGTPAPNLNKPAVKEAIAKGQALIKEGKSKADAARAMYEFLKDEDKELIVAAFVQGATLTEKGALTYWYNCKRLAQKEAKAAS